VSSRTVRISALIVGAAVALTACGGSGGKSGSSTTVGTTTPSTIAASQTAAGKPWVDAIIASSKHAANTPPGVTDAQIACVAKSLVDTYGATGFESAGYTIAKVKDPNSHLDKLPATPAQLSALGQRLQSCHLGGLLAPALSQQFAGATRPDTNACLTSRLDSDASAARFLALAFLNRDPDQTAARGLVDVLAGCVNLAAFAAKNLPELTATERSCVAPKLAASSEFRDLIAEEIVGATPTTAELVRAAERSMIGCVSAQRLAQLGRQP
jgi:hypothetical protein